jgi:23S rRNA pseudouridine2605 synthase
VSRANTRAGRRKGPLRAKTTRNKDKAVTSVRGIRRQAAIRQESQHSVWQTGELKAPEPTTIDLLEETLEPEITVEKEVDIDGEAAINPGVGIRVQKLLADRGYGSRRKMEGWIKEGRVMVNGALAELGHRVTPEDSILINGKTLQEKSIDKDTRVLMYHKPEGEICTQHDPGKRPTVFKQLPKIRGARWVSIGRLDINTSGLLLFTTNGALANRLMHPSSGMEREYRCRVYGEVTKEKLKQLIAGVEIDGHVMKFESIQLQKGESDKRNTWVHVVLNEGRNREVRKLWEAMECQVSRLTRLRYGPITLPRDLRLGKYRNLDQKQIERLASTG